MKAKIWKENQGRFRGMWRAACSCSKIIQYWDFGATLGAIQEHHRRGC